MIEIIIAIIAIVFIVDLYFGLSRRTRKMEFQFQRYSMFNMRSGNTKITLSKHYYNLPGNSDFECEFTISSDGYLDDIRQCNNVLIGGSMAFGMGCSGNSENISGFLRKKYQIDILNLAIPGWNIEQEVITLLRYITTIKPQKIVFLNGANNIAFGLPFDYHNYKISPDILSFYDEVKYADAVNQHFDRCPNLMQRLKGLLKEALSHSYLVRFAYRLLIHKDKNQILESNSELLDFDMLGNMAVKNYLDWLDIFVAIASSKGIEVHCVLQPYYLYGRSPAEITGLNFYNVNTSFDNYMISAYNKLDSALSTFVGITYHPIFRELATENVALFTDAVHLNGEGYEVVADRLKTIFDKEVLE